jgi:hypothetical protein
MDGGAKPLHTWEKLYWGVFVTALAGLLFSRLYRQDSPEPKVPCALKISDVKLTLHAVMRSSESSMDLASSSGAERPMECHLHEPHNGDMSWEQSVAKQA